MFVWFFWFVVFWFDVGLGAGEHSVKIGSFLEFGLFGFLLSGGFDDLAL